MKKERRDVLIKKFANWFSKWDWHDPIPLYVVIRDLELHGFKEEQDEIRSTLRHLAKNPNITLKDKNGVACNIRVIDSHQIHGRFIEKGNSAWVVNKNNLYAGIKVNIKYKQPKNLEYATAS